MIKDFKPVLFPNNSVEIEVINGHYMMSKKMDGFRIIICDGNVFTRTPETEGCELRFKTLQNKSIVERLQPLVKFAQEKNIILDGELFSDEIEFSELSGEFRRVKSQAPESAKFHAFDCLVQDSNWNIGAWDRYQNLIKYMTEFKFKYPTLEIAKVVEQIIVHTPAEVRANYEKFVEEGFEGAILKEYNSGYKFGRLTTASKQGYKLKEFRTFDAVIIGVVQSTKVDKNAAKKIDSFGRSHTSVKKGDRILIEKASAFVVRLNINIDDDEHPIWVEQKVTCAMTDEEKERVWRERETEVGRWIEFKGMLIGAKDKVRHPDYVRYRPDKE